MSEIIYPLSIYNGYCCATNARNAIAQAVYTRTLAVLRITRASLQLTPRALPEVVIILTRYTAKLRLNRATSPVRANERKNSASVRDLARYRANTAALARFTCNLADTSTWVCACACACACVCMCKRASMCECECECVHYIREQDSIVNCCTNYYIPTNMHVTHTHTCSVHHVACSRFWVNMYVYIRVWRHGHEHESCACIRYKVVIENHHLCMDPGPRLLSYIPLSPIRVQCDTS